MRRRAFVVGITGSAFAWPLAVRAQQSERIRRIGVLHTPAADDSEGQARSAAFLQGLQQLGWTDGRNVRIDTRWAAGDPDHIRRYVAELVALAPDVIMATGSATVGPLLQATRTVPIVFAGVPDPVGSGFVESLARPGGNATGFIVFEYGIGAKWLELLKQIAPNVTRVAVLRDPAITAGIGLWGAIQSVAPLFGVELRPVGVRDAAEIERVIALFGRSSDGGLIVTGSALAAVHRDLIVALAPDVILAGSSPAVTALQQLTHTVPIVFVSVVDPVGAGFVESLARPGVPRMNTASARNGWSCSSRSCQA